MPFKSLFDSSRYFDFGCRDTGTRNILRNARDAARFIIFTSLEARTSIRNPRIFFLSAVRNSSVETGNVINDQKYFFLYITISREPEIVLG